jgi:soluble lytic murein transglycosylase-like protein
MATSHQMTVYGLSLATLAFGLFVAGVGTGAGSTRLMSGPQALGCVPEEIAVTPNEPPAWADKVADAKQVALVKYLSRRFTIATEPMARMVEAAHGAAVEVGLDPLLVLAVISIESRFNPLAESAMGARGLMQIIPRFHLSKFKDLGGEDGVLDPQSNIVAGARILQEYVYRTGTLEAGLQFYNGAMADGSAQYAQKVFAERDRIQAAMRAALPAAAARSHTVSNYTKGS